MRRSPIALALPLASLWWTLGPAAAADPRFVERAAAAGLTVVTWSGGGEKNHILESTGNGVLVLDYDGDGYQDLYFAAAYRLPPTGDPEAGRGALYRNRGDGTFADVTAAAGLTGGLFASGGCVGDADGDGLPDLYLTAFGANRLYCNQGDGTFADVTAAAGVGDPRWSLGATFFDADGDGDQDLFVANYIEATWEEVAGARRTRRWRGMVDVLDGPRGLPGSANAFYRNRGDGTFVEDTAAAGLDADGETYSMGLASFDFDGDGDLDLYVANDSTPNALYRNRGDGTFEEIGRWSGAAYNADGNSQGSMGVDFGDYDGDGLFDLVVTNFANDYFTLYRNLDGELFLDLSFVAGVSVPTFVPLGWGALFLDADNDRDLDLFFANGHIYPQVDAEPRLHESYRQSDLLLLNESGRFRQSVLPDPAAGPRSSRGAVRVDLDNDGDLELVVSNQDDAPTLLDNLTGGAGSHWVLLDPRAGRGTALGARLEVAAGSRRQQRQTSSGGSYASSSDLRQHVGLGDAARLERLDATWPDGARRRYLDLPANRIYVLAR